MMSARTAVTLTPRGSGLSAMRAGDPAERHGRFDQAIIDGEARIGELADLINARIERGLDPAHATALIDAFEVRLGQWNQNRLRLIDDMLRGGQFPFAWPARQ